MPVTPNFARIVATITEADINRFLRSTAPDDDKQRVLEAPSIDVRMRLVGGYLIRTNQIKPERLSGAAGPKTPKVLPEPSTSRASTRAAKASKANAHHPKDRAD